MRNHGVAKLTFRNAALAAAICFCLFSLAACNTSVETSAPQVQGSLTCLTITPPETNVAKVEDLPTCDALCAEKGAVCTAVPSRAAGAFTCADHLSNNTGVCRCCAVKS